MGIKEVECHNICLLNFMQSMTSDSVLTNQFSFISFLSAARDAKVVFLLIFYRDIGIGRSRTVVIVL